MATGGAVRQCEARVASVPRRWTRRASSGDAGAAPVLCVNGAARVGRWLPFDLVLRLRALGRATPRYSRLEKERWKKAGGRPTGGRTRSLGRWLGSSRQEEAAVWGKEGDRDGRCAAGRRQDGSVGRGSPWLASSSVAWPAAPCGRIWKVSPTAALRGS
jgi:hypothetical protein